MSLSIKIKITVVTQILMKFLKITIIIFIKVLRKLE